MREARLVHIMSPTTQFIGYTKQNNYDQVVTLTEAVLITYQRGPSGTPTRTMRSIKSDKDYKGDEITIRGDCVIIPVEEVEKQGSLYHQYMQTLHPGRIQPVEKKLVSPGGGAMN
jgi:hypothetical protein